MDTIPYLANVEIKSIVFNNDKLNEGEVRFTYNYEDKHLFMTYDVVKDGHAYFVVTENNTVHFKNTSIDVSNQHGYFCDKIVDKKFELISQKEPNRCISIDEINFDTHDSGYIVFDYVHSRSTSMNYKKNAMKFSIIGEEVVFDKEFGLVEDFMIKDFSYKFLTDSILSSQNKKLPDISSSTFVREQISTIDSGVTVLYNDTFISRFAGSYAQYKNPNLSDAKIMSRNELIRFLEILEPNWSPFARN